MTARNGCQSLVPAVALRLLRSFEHWRFASTCSHSGYIVLQLAVELLADLIDDTTPTFSEGRLHGLQLGVG